ncbi:MAG TPA: lamin tail domain-containing protein, partial [Pyrinomonadaceae bacterium]|nr:lamin tail domain-containing protein [Pyrinomonadaceae bacterium]
MFSKVLLILIVAACLCLLIYPASALMQSKRPDFRLEVFNPLGQPAQSQSQSQETSAEVIDPTKPSNQTISVTLFDPRIPESDPRFIQNSGKIGASQQDLTPAAASDIRISQIYTRGGEAGATFQPDFIEIFNAGTTTININGWGIIVDTFEGSTEQAVGARYTSDTLVTPGMHLLIRFATAGNSGQPLTGVLPTVTSTSLGSTSGKIFLLSPSQTQTTGCPTSIGPSGTVSDLLGYGPTTCSEGSPAPAPPAANKSITRVNGNCLDTDNNSTDFTVTDPNPRNFTDIGTPCSGSNPAPTPGSGNLRISQVYTRGGEAGATYNQDYVELFNPGTGDVDINGWTLTVKTAEGGTTNNLSIVANQSFAITPGMHVTFPFNGNGTNGQALPSTKFTSTNTFLGSTSGQIILLAPGQSVPSGCPVSGNYVDFVGYGSSQCSETSPVPVPASNKSMTRING